MQWIFNTMAVLGLLLAGIGLMIDWLRHDDLEREIKELTHRENINDEVLTLHSEEIDELQRGRMAQGEKRLREMKNLQEGQQALAQRMTDLEKRMLEAGWDAAMPHN